MRKINCSTPLRKLDKFKNELTRPESSHVDLITLFSLFFLLFFYSLGEQTLICFRSNVAAPYTVRGDRTRVYPWRVAYTIRIIRITAVLTVEWKQSDARKQSFRNSTRALDKGRELAPLIKISPKNTRERLPLAPSRAGAGRRLATGRLIYASPPGRRETFRRSFFRLSSVDGRLASYVR